MLGCRYALPEHASLPELLADHMFNQGLVLGPRIASADDAPASMTITLSVDGQDAEQHAGIHPNGRPKAGLYWLANFLREQGAGLRAGQHVITGSYAGFLDVPAGLRSRDRLRRPGRAAPALRSTRLNGAAGARLYCAPVRAHAARGVTWRIRAPATMLTLRPLTAEDHSLLAGWFSSLADVVQWGGSQLSYPLTPLHVETMLAEGRSTPPARRCWMVCRNGAPVGHAQLAYEWHDGNARLGRVAVAPAMRGQGLARPLTALMIQEAFSTLASSGWS